MEISMAQENRQQNTDILQEKMNTYMDMLFKVAYFQMKNRQDAEDIVQEVFCQYLKSSREFESGEHEKAWLIKVTLNACRKVWRSAWYRHNTAMPEWEFVAESGTESDYIRREQSGEVLQSVLKLPAKYREVIHLFYYEDLSIKEICLVTGRQESTVTSQLTRGRELLRRSLKEDYSFE